jgi:N-acetylglucosaminyldiphosphoundecaprenol N-acetyl-beta-D-mannosaminyltransferase
VSFAPDRIDFLGIPLARITTAGFVSGFLNAIVARRPAGEGVRPLFVTYLNAACSNISANDAEYADVLRLADAVYADGQAIVWASRVLGRPLPERVNAADFIVEFCREAAMRGVSLYLLGSAEGVAAGAAAELCRQVPALDIRGAECGYFSDDGAAVTDRIRAASPDLLLLGLSVPLQEKWAISRLDRLGVRAVWCVGAMFEYHAGHRARAPVWVRKAGLEWLFRLALEPRRLWRRYIVGNVVFIWRVVRAALSR